MSKQTPLRSAVIIALAVTAAALCWLCFWGQQSDSVVNVDVPSKVADEPDCTAAIQISVIPEIQVESEDTAESISTTNPQTASAVTNRLGTLSIGGKEIPIADNVYESTLEKSPGWMPDSAMPGENGMCVILGHRNRKHLRPLENVKIGDEITFTYLDGQTALYTVCETVIYENTADWRMPSAAGDTLVLVTCWPFRYSGNAPGKYVTTCHLRE